MTFDVTVTRDQSAFGIPGWRDLLTRDPDRHIFATPEWHQVWWDEFGEDKELWLLTMQRDGGLRAVVPFYRKYERSSHVLRFLGGIELTDYLGPICSPEDRAGVADTLVEWLGDTEVTWTELDAHNMPVPFAFADFLVETADRRGFRYTLDQEETSAVLVLPDSWDRYLEQLKSKERHELRRKTRRLARNHPDAVVRSTSDESLERDLKIFFEMHRGAEGHKGHFMRPEIATFFERVAKAFMPLGWLRLDFLEIEDTAIASTFGFELDGTFYLYNSAYEPDAAAVSPGLVLVSELLKRCIDRGLEKFDFLRGPERYKYQLGAQAVPLNNVRVFNARGG